MAADYRIVSHNHIIADHAVMGNMRINHKHTIIADNSCQVFFRRTGVHSHIFADNIAFAYNQTRSRLKFIAVILRSAAKSGSGKNNCPLADCRISVNCNLSKQTYVFADFSLSANPAERSYFCTVRDLCAVFDNSCSMNFSHNLIPFLHIKH